MTFTLPNLSTILSTAGTWLPYISVAASLFTAVVPPAQTNNKVVLGLQSAIRAFALAIGNGTPAGAKQPSATSATPPAPPAA